MLPEGRVARGQERVLTGVPAEEVRRVDVAGMGFATGPNFVEQEGGRSFRGAMQIVGEAAVFFACGAHQGAELGFEEYFLTVAWSELHDKCDSILRELGTSCRP